MLEEALVALAAAGGTAVVQAAGTDAWAGVRRRVARLLGRNGQAELNRLEQAVDRAGPGDGDRPEQVEEFWRDCFLNLLARLEAGERAAAAAELGALVREHTARREAAGLVTGNTFHGPTAIQAGDRNRQVNHFPSA